MITAPAYQDKKIGVFGLARSGLAVVHSLVASGAKVFAWDDNAEARKAVRSYAVDLYDLDFSDLDALVLAPGVPLTHPKPHALVDKARAYHVPILCDMDVFEAARKSLPPHKVVGITGTNGKSTTTALIGHILETAGHPVAVGGNIGTGVLALNPLAAGGTYVFELSSFQLDMCQKLNCDVAVLLNITPDHLDRHGTMAGYVAAKAKMFDLQSETGIAVVAVDDKYSADIASGRPNLVPVSSSHAVAGGIYAADGLLVDDCEGGATQVGSIATIDSLRGSHNWQNAAAAYAACRALGLAARTILEGLQSFPGLAHRQEIVPFHEHVKIVNDSKATNVDAAVRALKTFDKIRWIAGGRAKDKDFSGLSDAVASVRKAYLMGEDAALIRRALPETLPVSQFETMAAALEGALNEAEHGDTILLSPACTAFDQFPDFEKRGEAFKAFVGQAFKAAAGDQA